MCLSFSLSLVSMKEAPTLSNAHVGVIHMESVRASPKLMSLSSSLSLVSMKEAPILSNAHGSVIHMESLRAAPKVSM